MTPNPQRRECSIFRRIILAWKLNRALAQRKRLRLQGFARPYLRRGG